MSRRVSCCLVAGAAALALLVGCGATPPPAPKALTILLVNDDGWNAPGVVSVREALLRAGHRVVEVAPDADRSDSGTAMTLAGPVAVRLPRGTPDVWSVRGSAADAASVGLRAVMLATPPDVVVSGIDSRHNAGLTAAHSGVVGAALLAANLGFPAVAVSTEAPTGRSRPEDYGPTADFTVRLLERLSRQASVGPLMARGTALNVNYPGGVPRARGVVAARTADTPDATVAYRYDPARLAMVPVVQPGPSPARDDVDVAGLRRGEATVSDLTADPDRSEPPPRTAVRLVPDLVP